MYARCIFGSRRAGPDFAAMQRTFEAMHALLTVVAEECSGGACFAPTPCLARVRLIRPGQTFTAAKTIDAELEGTATMKSQPGDLELCFHGSFGN